MTDAAPPKFTGMYLMVADMAASVAFYRRLGLEVAVGAENDAHVHLDFENGTDISLGTVALTKGYNPDYEAPVAGTPNVLQFAVASRQTVDDIHADLTQAGYRDHLAPFDAFWGNRYAEIADPDGNLVGLQSPPDSTKRGPPPI